MLDMVQTLFAIFSITPLLIPYTAAELNTRPRTNVVIVGMVKEIDPDEEDVGNIPQDPSDG